MCRSGFREVRVLCDARRPQICRSWAVVPSIRCFSSRDNRGNGFSAQSLRRAVERQLPSLLLQVAPESFMFNSAASAMEALQLMLYDADSHVSIVHVVWAVACIPAVLLLLKFELAKKTWDEWWWEMQNAFLYHEFASINLESLEFYYMM
jgi:hypothetical protein